MSLFSGSKRTNSAQKDKNLMPITLKMGATMAMRKVHEVIAEYHFDTLSLREEYHEIFARDGDFEYTFTFIEDFNKTHLSILCYSERKSLKIKKNLQELMGFLRNKLEGVIE